MLNRGAFALEIVRGLRKGPLKGGVHLLEVIALSPGWTVYVSVHYKTVLKYFPLI